MKEKFNNFKVTTHRNKIVTNVYQTNHKNKHLALQTVFDNCDLFPSEYLEGMIADYFDNSETDHIRFTTEEERKNILPVSFRSPMTFTNGT